MDGWMNMWDFCTLVFLSHYMLKKFWCGDGAMYQCALHVHVCLHVFCSSGKHSSFLRCSIHCHWRIISSYTDAHCHKFVHTHSYTHNFWPWSCYSNCCTSNCLLSSCSHRVGVGVCLLVLEKVLCDKLWPYKLCINHQYATNYQNWDFCTVAFPDLCWSSWCNLFSDINSGSRVMSSWR